MARDDRLDTLLLRIRDRDRPELGCLRVLVLRDTDDQQAPRVIGKCGDVSAQRVAGTVA